MFNPKRSAPKKRPTSKRNLPPETKPSSRPRPGASPRPGTGSSSGRPSSRPGSRPNARPETGTETGLNRPSSRPGSRPNARPETGASRLPGGAKRAVRRPGSSGGSGIRAGAKKFTPKRNLISSQIPAPSQDRLQKIIAGAGLCSRREAERLIANGRVSVGGQTITAAGLKVDPYRDRIVVDGYLLPPPQKLHYYMFHKPAGYLTTLSDPQGRPTIKTFLDQLPVRVFPVGRLDMDVEGLLILTNDGDLAKSLMHPASKVPKCYRVKVSGLPDAEDMDRLRHGQLMIGQRQAAPAEAEILKTAADRSWLLLTLTEGRHHQVKRMCSAIGHSVMKLKRISYAGLELGPLRREVIRPLNWAEVEQLRESSKNS